MDRQLKYGPLARITKANTKRVSSMEKAPSAGRTTARIPESSIIIISRDMEITSGAMAVGI